MIGVEKEREQLVEHASASNLFSELAYEQDYGLYYLEDGMLGFVFDLMPMNGADQTTLEQLVGVLSQDWAPGSFLQLHLIPSADLEVPLCNSVALRDPANKLLYTTAEKRADFLRRGSSEIIGEDSGALVRDFKLILTAKTPCNQPPEEQNLKKTYMIKTAVESALGATGFKPKRMTASNYVRLMKSILNWDEKAQWRHSHDNKLLYNENELLREQFLDPQTEIGVTKNHLRLGKKYAQCLSVKQYPEHVHLGIPASYIADPRQGIRGIKRSFMITASIHFPDSEQKREIMNSKRGWVIKQSQGPLLKFVPRLEAQYHDFDTLFKALDDGDRIVDFNLSVVLFDDSEEKLQNSVSNVKTYYRTLGLNLLEDDFFHLPIFLNALPLGADRKAMNTLGRYCTMATRHAVRLLPFLSDWKGTGTPLMQFTSRTGQLMNIDLFDSGTNFNGVIAAQSGSGKSFLTNEITMAYLGTGDRVWTIDVGRSYEKLCNVLDGKFMVFSEQSQICLNPFDVTENYEEEAGMIVGLLVAMAAPNDGLSDFQIAHLRRILTIEWEKHGRNLTIDRVAEALIEEGARKVQEHQEKAHRISDIGEQLFPFTTKGEFGKWFNGKNNLNMDNRYVVLELEELKGKKDLQTVVLLQLIYQIQQEMYLGERDQRKVLVMDEAWDLLSSPSVAKFIETGYRRFRKYGGCALTITQSINDLYNSHAGVAIAENSANMVLLRQKGQTIDSIREQKRLPLSDGGYDLLKTVHTNPGKYSEIFFMTEAGAGLGRLIVNRFQQLLYSTNHSEVQAIKNYVDQGYPQAEAIDLVVRDEEVAKMREESLKSHR